MKILFIGCVTFSYQLLEHLLSTKKESVEVVGIITRYHSNFNADFCSLQPLAANYNIPWMYTDQKSLKEIENWIKNKNPKVIYCFGWSYLLKKEILEIPEYGVVGYHPADLPKNRGRHPIIWALALGLEQTASTFFIMDESADSGDIISQKKVQIDKNDDAKSLYIKLIETAQTQVEELTKQFETGTINRLAQENNQANYWRKRNVEDGEIDWRMSSNSIYNLIRALTKPYVGAHCLYNDQIVKIWRANIIKDKRFVEEIQHLEPGKVLISSYASLVVKCGEGAIEVIDHEFHPLPEEGYYL